MWANNQWGIRLMGVFTYALVADTIADCTLEDVFYNSRIDRWITAISSALGDITGRLALVVRLLRSRRSHEPAQDLPLGVRHVYIHRSQGRLKARCAGMASSSVIA